MKPYHYLSLPLPPNKIWHIYSPDHFAEDLSFVPEIFCRSRLN